MGIIPAIPLAVSSVESGFDPSARSGTDARGVMQVEPETARQFGADPERLFEPEYGIHTGLTVMRDLLDYYDGWIPGVLAAYYAGRGFSGTQSPEVRADILHYVHKVYEQLPRFAQYRCR
jgi:soluble lytic murein transglycosylase-like protein